jgi:hypothetical protein
MDSKKRSVSCDVCRARKVKCVKPEGAARCEGCVTLDQHCTYTHERKKPGPANRYVLSSYGQLTCSFARKTMSPTRDFYASLDSRYAPGPSRSEASSSMPPPPNRWPSDNGNNSNNHNNSSHNSSNNFNYGQYNNYEFNSNPHPPPQPHHDNGVDLSWLPISPNSLLHPQPGEADSTSEGSPMGRWLHNTMQVNEWEQALFGPLPPSDPPSASGSGTAPNQVPVHPTRKSRVEDIVAWSVVMKILHAYHAHL